MTKNSIIQKITIVFLLVLSLKGFSQTTVVLNPVSDATDKSTGASDVQNVLRLQRWGSGTQWNPYGFKHFYLDFDVKSLNIPYNAQITNAEIHLTPFENKWKNIKIGAFKCKEKWDNSITWGNKPETLSNSEEAVFDLKNNNGSVVVLNVTKDVQGIHKYGASDFGWKIAQINANKNHHWSFYHSEIQGQGKASKKPKLVITYEINVEPISIEIDWKKAVTVFGGNDGEAKLIVSGGSGSGNYSYMWYTTDAQAGVPPSFGNDQSHAKELKAGKYAVTVFDADDQNIFTSFSFDITSWAVLYKYSPLSVRTKPLACLSNK